MAKTIITKINGDIKTHEGIAAVTVTIIGINAHGQAKVAIESDISSDVEAKAIMKIVLAYFDKIKPPSSNCVEEALTEFLYESGRARNGQVNLVTKQPLT